MEPFRGGAVTIAMGDCWPFVAGAIARRAASGRRSLRAAAVRVGLPPSIVVLADLDGWPCFYAKS